MISVHKPSLAQDEEGTWTTEMKTKQTRIMFHRPLDKAMIIGMHPLPIPEPGRAVNWPFTGCEFATADRRSRANRNLKVSCCSHEVFEGRDDSKDTNITPTACQRRRMCLGGPRRTPAMWAINNVITTPVSDGDAVYPRRDPDQQIAPLLQRVIHE